MIQCFFGGSPNRGMVPRMALYRNGYRIPAVEHFGDRPQERIHFINPLA